MHTFSCLCIVCFVRCAGQYECVATSILGNSSRRVSIIIVGESILLKKISKKQTKYVSNALVMAVVCFSKVIGELSVMAETCVHGFLDNNNNILY